MELRDKVIYQLFVRHFTEEGTFRAAEKKLPYLKSLNIDIIQLLPICPIGIKGRKGTLGSPYAIKDYEEVNPEFGTIEDCRHFISEANKHGMKVIFDVVYNHTSRDARLLSEHPEWYYHNENDEPSNKVGDWWDVYDLDHDALGLDEYLVTVLEKYVSWGASGFRFDVCSLLPKRLFELARKALPRDTIFIGEAVDASFVNELRGRNIHCLSYEELFEAGFDALYHYSSWMDLRKYLETGELIHLERYKSVLNLESAGIRKEGVIIRALENHDQKRIASYRDDMNFAKNLLAYSFFTRGPAFIYNGEEAGLKDYPDFFEKSYSDLSSGDPEYLEYVKSLIEKKHSPENTHLLLSECLLDEGPTLKIKNHYEGGKKVIGTFDLSDHPTGLPTYIEVKE